MSTARKNHALLVAATLIVSLVLSACGGSNPGSQSDGGAKSDTSSKPAATSNYPSKPIKLVITHRAGGSTDAIARLVQPYLSKYLNGNPVVVENMEGAGGNISRAHVYNAEPDGYTLLVSQFPSMMIGELVQNGNFKTLEMTPVYQITGNQAQMIVVPGDHAAKTFKDLTEASKKKKISLAGPGLGSNGHLAFGLFRRAGVEADYVPFNSGPESLTAVAGKQTDAATADAVSMSTLVKEGKIRILATSGTARDPLFPDVPTLIELGHQGLGFDISIGVIGPAKLPPDVLKVLEDAFSKALKDPDFTGKAKNANFDIAAKNSAEFRKAIEADYKLVENFKPLLSAK